MMKQHIYMCAYITQSTTDYPDLTDEIKTCKTIDDLIITKCGVRWECG